MREKSGRADTSMDSLGYHKNCEAPATGRCTLATISLARVCVCVFFRSSFFVFTVSLYLSGSIFLSVSVSRKFNDIRHCYLGEKRACIFSSQNN